LLIKKYRKGVEKGVIVPVEVVSQEQSTVVKKTKLTNNTEVDLQEILVTKSTKSRKSSTEIKKNSAKNIAVEQSSSSEVVVIDTNKESEKSLRKSENLKEIKEDKEAIRMSKQQEKENRKQKKVELKQKKIKEKSLKSSVKSSDSNRNIDKSTEKVDFKSINTKVKEESKQTKDSKNLQKLDKKDSNKKSKTKDKSDVNKSKQSKKSDKKVDTNEKENKIEIVDEVIIEPVNSHDVVENVNPSPIITTTTQSIYRRTEVRTITTDEQQHSEKTEDVVIEDHRVHNTENSIKQASNIVALKSMINSSKNLNEDKLAEKPNDDNIKHLSMMIRKISKNNDDVVVEEKTINDIQAEKMKENHLSTIQNSLASIRTSKEQNKTEEKQNLDKKDSKKEEKKGLWGWLKRK